jgi:hypothetical protein
MNNFSKLLIIPVVAAAAMPAIAMADTVTSSQAGTLSTLLEGKTDITELAIKGSINAADFAFIQDKLNNLTTLDLSGATIIAYSGDLLPYSNVAESEANAVPPYALTGLTKLTTVTLPSSVTKIGAGAFSGSGITSISLPAKVTTIDNYAFLRCTALTTVTIPGPISSIGDKAFAYCTSLAEVNLPTAGNTSTLTALPEGLFEACSQLTSIDLEGLTMCKEIGPWALAECKGLTTLVLPEATTRLGEGALLKTSALNSLSLGKNLTTIADNALSGASALRTLVLPAPLDSIGSYAMQGMTELTNINVSELTSVPELGDDVWANVEQAEVTLVTPDDLTENFKDAAQWQNFQIISRADWDSSTDNVENSADADARILAHYADGILTISTTGSTPITGCALYDVAGSRVALYAGAAHGEISLDVRNLSSGVYLVVTNVGVLKTTIKK